LTSSSRERSSIIDTVIKILSEYPLCDNCLGRCFARLGYGLDNKERGKAIKTFLILYLDHKIKNHEIEDLSVVKEISQNMGELSKNWFNLYFSSDEFQTKKCYICANKIEEYKTDFLDKSLQIIKSKQRKYVLGVELDEEIKMKENEIMNKFNLFYMESIKNEIKRDVGKRLTQLGFPPDIDNPDIELIYTISTKEVKILEKRTKTLYVYNRLTRNLPISSWFSKDKEGLDNLIGKKIILAFSEPSDVRIITEYPLIIEDEEREKININGYNIVKMMSVGKKEIESISNLKPSRKKYRITVYSQTSPPDAFKLFDNIYDIFIDCKSFDELKEKIDKMKLESNVIVLSIDLIDVEGRINNLVDTYIK